MLDRRRLLGGGLAGAALLLAGRAGAQPLVPQDPRWHMMRLARLQGDVTGRTIYSYSRGQVFGLIGGQGLPIADYGRLLYCYEGCAVRRSRMNADGAVETVQRAWLFYQDPETGAYIKRFRNPYTGREIDVPAFRAGISGGLMTPEGARPAANFTMESTALGRPVRLDVEVMGDMAFVRRHAFTRWTPPGASRARTEFTLDGWTVPVAELMADGLGHIHGTHSWTSQTEWQSWLGMPDDHPGGQLWKADGRVFASIDALPPAFVQHCRTEHPGILTDPLEFRS